MNMTLDDEIDMVHMRLLSDLGGHELAIQAATLIRMQAEEIERLRSAVTDATEVIERQHWRREHGKPHGMRSADRGLSQQALWGQYYIKGIHQGPVSRLIQLSPIAVGFGDHLREPSDTLALAWHNSSGKRSRSVTSSIALPVLGLTTNVAISLCPENLGAWCHDRHPPALVAESETGSRDHARHHGLRSEGPARPTHRPPRRLHLPRLLGESTRNATRF
jgi:hypothetical protein